MPGSITDSNANTQLAWTPNSRRLLAIHRPQMPGYNTTTQTTHTITFTHDPLQHLTTPGQAATETLENGRRHADLSVIINFGVGAGASSIVQAVTGGTGSPADSAFPPLGVVLKSLAVASLNSLAYGTGGIALGTLCPSAGPAIAVALLGTQGVVVLLDTLALQVGGVLETLNDLTPDASASSLTQIFGAVGGGANAEVYFRVDRTVSASVLANYAVAFFGLGALLMRRRDVTLRVWFDPSAPSCSC